MRIIAIICLFIVLFITSGKAQTLNSLFYREKEKMLQDVYEKIKLAGKADKRTAELAFRDSLAKVLELKESFLFPFDSLKQIGRIVSEDNRIAIFSWNVPQGMFHRYYCIIQYNMKKDDKHKVIPLIEKQGILKRNPQAIASANNWPGALYYKVIKTRHKGETYYTLLGYNMGDLLSNYKLIEVIHFDKTDSLIFRQNTIQYKGKAHSRLIFEYAERAGMLLDYRPEREMIVFDHLSPFRPSLEGKRQFYGPDFSYDGLLFEDGRWKHQSDIDIRP